MNELMVEPTSNLEKLYTLCSGVNSCNTRISDKEQNAYRMEKPAVIPKK